MAHPDEQGSVTNAPISEDERAVTRERAEALRRPFPWLALAGALALAGLAVVAAFTAGAQYAIPFGVFAVLAALFVGVHRMLGQVKTQRYDEPGKAQEQAAEDADDPVPHMGFDEESQLGQTAQLSDEEQASHADMERSTGQS